MDLRQSRGASRGSRLGGSAMVRAQLLILLVHATLVPDTISRGSTSWTTRRPAAASPTRGMAPRSTPNPALLPNLKVPPLVGLAVPVDVWEKVASILFPNAGSIQIYWVRLTARAHSVREREVTEVFNTLWVTVAASMGKEMGFPYVLWTVSEGVVPVGVRQYVDRHREDRLGEFSLVIAAYTEERDDKGDLSLRQLQRLDVWFPRSYYIVLLDTWSLPLARRCDESLALNVSLAVWLSNMTTVGVVLVRCPWKIVLHDPFVLDPKRRRTVIHQSNVTALEDVVGDRRFRNFHGWAWPISMLEYAPTLMRAEDGSYYGIDGSVFMAATKYFNFTPVIDQPADKEPLGYSDDGKTGTGTLGKVMSGESWISFNSRFRKDYNTKDIDFTYPYSFDELCVMVPQAERIPNYITIFRIFRIEVWLTALLAYLCTALAAHLLDRAHAARRARTFRRPGPCGLAYSAFLLIMAGSMDTYSGVREISSRMLFGAALLFSLNFMGAYQGLLFKALTMPQYFPQIDSMLALADSGIAITTRSTSLVDTFKADNAIMTRLQTNFKLVPKNWTTNIPVSSLARRNGAYLRKENANLHLVEECPRKYQLAYIVHRNFPYIHQMNIFLLRCMDVGLMDKWFRDTYLGRPPSSAEDDMVLSLFEVEGAFFLLAIGVLASSVAFSAELLHSRCQRGRAPRPRRAPRKRHAVARGPIRRVATRAPRPSETRDKGALEGVVVHFIM
ncbi:uncharacterized protein LOC113209861 [Frankliniella occidentalis]|uniref:Uncharacterized protein LOC113209861 n=1 Tax=Frankliniella occidentalis TaxID=133901 RepID=A0A9C6WVZ8_FRAOC|nr:uncharacterized protein LOC113209861 [Frankliniella occidentalis]